MNLTTNWSYCDVFGSDLILLRCKSNRLLLLLNVTLKLDNFRGGSDRAQEAGEPLLKKNQKQFKNIFKICLSCSWIIYLLVLFSVMLCARYNRKFSIQNATSFKLFNFFNHYTSRPRLLLVHFYAVPPTENNLSAQRPRSFLYCRKLDRFSYDGQPHISNQTDF